VCAVHVVSAHDREAAALGDLRCVDAETGEARVVDVTPAVASAYRDAWEQHGAAVEAFCRRYQMAYVRASAEDPFEQVMLHTFRQGGFVA
jgi:hypothetical protein